MVKMYDIKIKPPKLKSKKLEKRGIHIKITPPKLKSKELEKRGIHIKITPPGK